MLTIGEAVGTEVSQGTDFKSVPWLLIMTQECFFVNCRNVIPKKRSLNTVKSC
jgi:hypothetical protein